MLSWYDVALKLRLPDIISQGSADSTVLENLVGTLVKESSLRTRRTTDLTVAGLATMPRPRSLPALEAINNGADVLSGSVFDSSRHDHSNQHGGIGSRPRSGEGNREMKAEQKQSAAAAATSQPTKHVLHHSMHALSHESAQIIKKQMELNAAGDKFKFKPSSENWIPEITRMKSLERDLSVAKETLADIMVREMGTMSMLKTFSVSDLEHARVAESLGKIHKMACGCCLQKFLPVNLPLKVSQKAVLDIRIRWSGGLSSATVFGGSSGGGGALEDAASTEEGGKKTGAAPKDKFSESRLSAVPRCYDEVRVCAFCAQFFHDQDSYRPSFLRITYDERRAAFFEAREREKQYWDPLKMCEKDRAAADEEEADSANLAAQNLKDNDKDGDSVQS